MDHWYATIIDARTITEEKLFEVYRKIVRIDGHRFLPTLLESFLGRIW
jgi:hypothetical protein